MDIGIITPSNYLQNLSGSNVSVKLLAESLTQRRHKVTVYAFDGYSYSEAILNGVCIKVFKRSSKDANRLLSLNYSTYKHLRKLIDSHDLIHVYSGWQIPAAAALNVPTVVTLNNYQPICPKDTLLCPSNAGSGLKFDSCARCIISRHRIFSVEGMSKMSFYCRNMLYGVISLRADDRICKYIALSEVVKQKFVHMGIAEEKIVVIPNMLDARFVNLNYSEPDDVFTILYVGQLYESKGVDLLVRAVQSLRDQELRLKIVGYGPSESSLQQLVSSLDLNEKVEFMGKVDNEELPEVYRSAHLFVHPGIWEEPFGRSVLEAMASGVPVVTSDVGAPPMIVGDCGITFRCGDVKDLADAIQMLMDDKMLRKELGIKGRLRALKDYDANLIVDKIEKAYSEALICLQRRSFH